MKSIHIGIAGAGISGLMAGLEILSAGHAVTIFEARHRVGGRILSIDVDGTVVEAGPEFIHGNLKETIGLLKKYKIRYDPIYGKNYAAKKGLLKESVDMVEGWDSLMEKMRSLNDDIPFGKFLEKNFPGNRFHALRETATGFAEGFDLADIQTVSTRALYIEWENGEAEQYRIPNGLERWYIPWKMNLSRGGKILTDHRLKVWNGKRGIKFMSDDRVFNLDKLIINLPLSAFRQNFRPESILLSLLGEKEDAFRQIGFGGLSNRLIWESAF